MQIEPIARRLVPAAARRSPCPPPPSATPGSSARKRSADSRTSEPRRPRASNRA